MSGAPYTAQPEPRLTLRLTLGDDPAIRGQVEKIVLDLIKSNPDFEFSDSSDLENLEPSPIYPDHPKLAFLARPRTLQISQPSAMGNDDFHAFLIQLLAQLQAAHIALNQSIDFDDAGYPLEASLKLIDLQSPEDIKKKRQEDEEAELPSSKADGPQFKAFCVTSPWNRLHISYDEDDKIIGAPFDLRRDCLEAEGWSLLEFNAQNQRKIEQINQIIGDIKKFVLENLRTLAPIATPSAPPAEKFRSKFTGKLYDLDEDSFVKKDRDPRSLDQLYEETKFPVMHGLDEEIFTSDAEYLDRPIFSYLTSGCRASELPKIKKTEKQKEAPGAGAGAVIFEDSLEEEPAFKLSQLFIQYLLPAGNTAGAGGAADLADLTTAFRSLLETPGPLTGVISHLLEISEKLGDLQQDLINSNHAIATHLITNAIEAAESYKGLTTSRGLGRHKKFIFENELIYKILKKNLSEIQLSYLGDSRDYLELTKASFIQWQTRHGHELAHRRFFTCRSPVKHPTDAMKITGEIAAVFGMQTRASGSTSGAARGYGSMGSIQQERAKSTAGSEMEMVASGPKPTDDCLTPLLQRNQQSGQTPTV